MPATKPQNAEEAIQPPDIDPGGLDRIEQEATEGEPHEPDETKTGWIEVVLLDEADRPVIGERVEITLPNGRVARSRTNDEGLVRIDGIDSGDCDICFSRLDEGAWE